MKKQIITLLALSVVFAASAESLSKQQTKSLNDKIKDYDYVGDFRNNRALVTKDMKTGFINKSGEVVIPLQYENVMNRGAFREGLWCDESVGVIDSMGKRVVPEGKVTRIERLPSAPHWQTNRLSNVKNTDIVQIETAPDKKVTYCFQSGKLLFVLSNDWPVVNANTGEFLSTKKKGNVKYFGEEELKKQGYQEASPNGAKLGFECEDALVMMKNGKYGVVDMNFNVVYPFVSENRLFQYVGGSVLATEVYVYEGDFVEVIPMSTTLYRNNKVVADKLYNSPKVLGDYIYFDGEQEGISERYGIQTPESAKKKVLCTLDGKEVEYIPVGTNKLKPVVANDVTMWMYQDAKGNPIINEKAYLTNHFGKKVVCIQTESSSQNGLNEICIDVATGDTAWIPEGLPFFSHLEYGSLKLSELSKYCHQYSPLLEYDVTYSKQDNDLNRTYLLKENYDSTSGKYSKELIDSKSGRKVVTGLQTIYSFSDGLLRVKLNNRWLFLNDKGEGFE